MKSDLIKKRLKYFAFVAIGLLAVLLIRLAVVQLFNNDIYQTQAKENSIRLVSIKAPRGEIYTNDGQVLAANELVYNLSLNPLGMKDEEEVIGRLVELLKNDYPEISEDIILEKLEVQKYRLFEMVIILRDIPWELVVKLEENRQDLPGVTITVEPLRYYPQGELAGHVLGYIHSISPEEISAQEEGGGEKYDINSLIGKSGIEKQYESYLRGIDGARRVEVDSKGHPIRELVTLEPHAGNNIYLTIDMDMQKVLQKSMANVLEQIQKQYPKAKVGSAAVIEVKTGKILAMHSAPDMYPDDWKGNISTDRAAYYYPQGSYNPLEPGGAMNRAIQVTYPPGSTFKPITGMAALESNSVNSLTDYVTCQGNYWIAPYIRCWQVHGNVNYYSAMAGSCNTYFQEMGRRAGKDEIIKVAKQFGLGTKTGIDIPHEVSGLLPTEEWKKEINGLLIDRKYNALREKLEEKYKELEKNAADEKERSKLEQQKKNEKAILEAQYKIDYNFDTNWQAFDTFNMSIGQGNNNYTVIQLANYTATIANGGNLMRPYLGSKITSADGDIIKEFEPQLIKKADVSGLTIAETKRAMLAVTEPGGTAHYLFAHFPENIKVCAKTGTAQTGRVGDNVMSEFHGTFIAFAPYDDPEIAFAGIVEYGQSGSGSAGYVARDVFEHYFHIKNHLDENTVSNVSIRYGE
ncbi:MAG: penicillin-binding protein 2 [Syntrophomonadaceae bacterium]|jgi:penicillin-binding protein 2|nr:penicillin-binding protein 2 [Syntrophomonadaceae bacterium]